MNVQFQNQFDNLTIALQKYARASGRMGREIVSKKLGTGRGALGTELAKSFKKMSPVKKQITEEQLARLRGAGRGGGIRISPAVVQRVGAKYQAFSDLATHAILFGKYKRARGYAVVGGRRMNFQQLLVAAELRRRESSRLFTARSGTLSRPGPVVEPTPTQNFLGVKLGEAKVQSGNNVDTGTMIIGDFGELSQAAAHALARSRGQQAVVEALAAVESDMMKYVSEKDFNNMMAAFKR